MDPETALAVLDGAVDTDLDPRTVRALAESMTLLEDGGEQQYRLFAHSGREYQVDLLTDYCTCPDHQQRGRRCKHLRRTTLETGEDPEQWADVQAELGRTLLGIDDEITRLQERIAELEAAQRALARLVDRVEDLRPADVPTDTAAASDGTDATPADDTAPAVTPADD